MSNVIPFSPAAVKHRTGAAICRGCRHEWDAVTEGDGLDLECPECATMKGTFKWTYGACEGQAEYKCNCGCFDYFIMKKTPESVAAVYCRNCGNESVGWFE